ncbi:hypothetical protein [Sedimenticola sp.]|uniref:hypothetical protein n=1 Tax=Sedimenticola sp. TaxID=1940285 RepID=UPI003D119C16
MHRIVQITIATIPLLLTPVLLLLIGEDILSFGGGEKDVVIAIPWLIWSLIFAVSSYVLIFKRWRLRRWWVRSAIVATATLVILWLVLFLLSIAGLV